MKYYGIIIKSARVTINLHFTCSFQANSSNSGTVCPICGMVSHGREHIARHFIKELMEVVSEFPDPTACPECNYR